MFRGGVPKGLQAALRAIMVSTVMSMQLQLLDKVKANQKYFK